MGKKTLIFYLAVSVYLILANSCSSLYYRMINDHPPEYYHAEAQKLINNTPIELKLRIFLTEKFDPVFRYEYYRWDVSTAADWAIYNHPVLAAFIRIKYGLIEKFDIYNKMEQLQRIDLIQTESGYDFFFMEGLNGKIQHVYGYIVLTDGKIANCKVTKIVEMEHNIYSRSFPID